MLATLRRSLVLAAAAGAALTGIVACNKMPDEPPLDLGENDVSDNAAPDEEPPNPEPEGEIVDPGDEGGDAGAVMTDEEMMDGGSKPAADAGSSPAPAPAPAPTSLNKTVNCTSTYGSHKSVTSLSWTVSGSNAIIKSVSITVTNAYRRNLNDVDVWVRPPNGSEYLAYNSGDVLASGRTVTIKAPSNWTKPLGTRIRFETNFDQEGSDPSASCSITLAK